MPLGQGAVRHLCAVGASRAPLLTELYVCDLLAVGGPLDRAGALRRVGRWTKREVDERVPDAGRPSCHDRAKSCQRLTGREGRFTAQIDARLNG